QDFSLADESANVIRICQLLEGLPLGIVLAASWLETLSLDEIANEISRSLDVLTTNLLGLPARHLNIRAVFDSSCKQLTPDQRDAFMKLSVFRGGFTRDAAHKVAGAALPTLAALVDKSLVRHDPAGRYDLHELLRQYAQEKLQADERGKSVQD